MGRRVITDSNGDEIPCPAKCSGGTHIKICTSCGGTGVEEYEE